MNNFRLGLVLVALLLALVAGQNHFLQSSGAQDAAATAVCESQSQACDSVPDVFLAPVTAVGHTVYSEACLVKGDLYVLRYAVGDTASEPLAAPFCG